MPLACQIGAHLRRGLAERERLRLREAIGEREILLLLEPARARSPAREIERDARGALVQQLEERMLRVVAGLAPDDRPVA